MLFMAALFALPIGTCGGIGASKANDGGRQIVATTPAELGLHPDGLYVSFDAPLRHVGTGKVPLDDRMYIELPGRSIYVLEGNPRVYVVAKENALAAGSRVHVEGRLCSDDSHIVCTTDEALRPFLTEQERHLGKTVRIVTAGEKPSENYVEAGIGLGIAGVLLVLLVGLLVFLARGRKRNFLCVEHVVPMRDGLDPGSLAQRLGFAFRPAQLTPPHLVFLTGHPASRAQLVGAFRPDDFPQRVEIWLESGGSSYRQAQARIRVSEIFAQPLGPPAQLKPQVDAALGMTMQRVTAALSG